MRVEQRAQVHPIPTLDLFVRILCGFVARMPEGSE